MLRTPLTELEWSIIEKLKRSTLPPATAAKRFIRSLTRNSQLSDNGRNYLAFLAYRFRRQYSLTGEEMDWMKERYAKAYEPVRSQREMQDQKRLAQWEALYGRRS